MNIRYRSEGYWQGQAPSGGRPPAFCRFYDLKWGFRAAFRLMLTYYERYHLDTVEKIVSRWAPSSENDTKGYIAFVVNELGKRGFGAGQGRAPLTRQQTLIRTPLTRQQPSIRPPLPPFPSKARLPVAFPTQEGNMDTMTLDHPRENPRLWIALVVAMAKMECGAKRIGLAEEKACEEGYHLLFD